MPGASTSCPARRSRNTYAAWSRCSANTRRSRPRQPGAEPAATPCARSAPTRSSSTPSSPSASTPRSQPPTSATCPRGCSPPEDATDVGLLLGVDGGNTKTIAVVARRDGSVAGVGKSGLSDIHGAPTPSDGVGEIVRAVDAALAVAGASVADLDAATFSLAGADWPEDFVYLRGELVRRLALGGEPAIVNDAVGAIRSGSPDWTGIAVVCGTGCAVGARNVRGDVFHYGFWPDGTGGGALGAQGL